MWKNWYNKFNNFAKTFFQKSQILFFVFFFKLSMTHKLVSDSLSEINSCIIMYNQGTLYNIGLPAFSLNWLNDMVWQSIYSVMLNWCTQWTEQYGTLFFFTIIFKVGCILCWNLTYQT